jgi:hypothetical protein
MRSGCAKPPNESDARTFDEIVKLNFEHLREGLRSTFCSCSAEFTSDPVDSDAASLQQALTWFHIPDIPLSEILISSTQPIFAHRLVNVYCYPPEANSSAFLSLQ